MTEVRRAKELSVLRYVEELQLNPQNVYYQRVTSNNYNSSRAMFSGISPSRRALLLNYAQVQVTANIEKSNNATAGAGNARAFSTGDRIRLKPFLPLHNCMSSISFTINGAVQTHSQPRRYSKILGLLYGKKACDTYLSSAGGAFNSLTGSYYSVDSGGSALLGAGREAIGYGGDPNFQKACERFEDLLRRSTAPAISGGAGTAAVSVSWTEPLLIPPFNPFAMVTKDLPSYCPFKHMSPVIPHANNWELSMQFQRFVPSVFYPFCSVHGNAGTEINYLHFSRVANTNNLTQMDLLLYWYVPPLTESIPQSISLQSYYIREFVATAPRSLRINSNATVTGGFDSGLIQLQDVPDLIVFHAEADKDSTAGYNSVFATTSQDIRGTAANLRSNAAEWNIACYDDFCEISAVRIIIGNTPNVIDTSFTQEELYQLTAKNSAGMTHDFSRWRGLLKGTTDAANNNGYPGQCFVALRPSDLSEYFSPGTNAPISIQITATLTARSSVYPHIAGAADTRVYSGYVHLLYGKRMLNISADKAEYVNQAISSESAMATLYPTVNKDVPSIAGLSMDQKPSFKSRIF